MTRGRKRMYGDLEDAIASMKPRDLLVWDEQVPYGSVHAIVSRMRSEHFVLRCFTHKGKSYIVRIE